MKKILAIAIAAATLVSPLTTPANAKQTQHVEGSTYVVEGAKVHYHYSQIVGQLYEFNVALPNSYWSEPEREYPVVYVLDGQWDFTLTSSIVGKTNYDGMIPDVITVAITWGGENDDPNMLRNRDYVPSEFPFIPNTGGAENFLAALEEELIPYINSIYRNNDQAVLMGSSFGGLFTSYAMVEKPELFDGYIAMAAPYGLEAPYFFSKLEETRNSDHLNNIRAYFGAGTLDGNLESVNTFVEQLAAGNYPGFAFEHSTLENMGHSAGSIAGYAEGLQYIFERAELDLSSAILNRYTGTYTSTFGPNFPPVSISHSDGELILHLPQQPPQTLSAQSETEFYVKGVNFNVTFEEQESAWAMTINSQGNAFPFIQNTQ